MFDRVLVAVDESASSENTFLCALELTRVLEAELVIIHVLDMFDPASLYSDIISADCYPAELYDGTSLGSPNLAGSTGPNDEGPNNKSLTDEGPNDERRWREFSEHAEMLLKKKQTEAESFGLTARYLQPYGRAGPIICKVAETIHADLIVVGSRNYVHLRGLILGSVSSYILHNSPCSVTVVHWHRASSPVLKSLPL